MSEPQVDQDEPDFFQLYSKPNLDSIYWVDESDESDCDNQTSQVVVDDIVIMATNFERE